MTKDTFIWYKKWTDALSEFDKEIRLEVREAVEEYAFTGNVPNLKTGSKMAFSFIRQDIDRDAQAYIDKCNKNRKNGAMGADFGKLGGRPKKTPKTPNGDMKTPKNHKKPHDYDNDYDNDFLKEKNKKEIFEIFRKSYQGRKDGFDTEFNRLKKHNDWESVIPNLLQALENEIQWRKLKKEHNAFVPEWANLKTWISQRRWEQEFDTYFEDNEIEPPSKEFLNFKEWILKKTPNVAKIKMQFTESEHWEIRKLNNEIVKEILLEMDKDEQITNYLNANLTFKIFLERRNNAN